MKQKMIFSTFSWFDNYLMNQVIQVFKVSFNPELFLRFSFINVNQFGFNDSPPFSIISNYFFNVGF